MAEQPKLSFISVPLTREIAQKHAVDLALLANQIPQVEYSTEDILAEQKGNRFLFNKWQHSLIVIDSGKPIAFIMGYERESENNEEYPKNTLYMSELAVAKEYQHQGIARSLLRQFFAMNSKIGFQTLSGELNYSVQTNSVSWNRHVISLYESFGFKQRATKKYSNRTDVVLGAEMDAINLAGLKS